MFIRILLGASFVLISAAAQEKAPDPKKPAAAPQIPNAKDHQQRTCAIPLSRVTPPSMPYMPTIKPRADKYAAAMFPAPPVCEDRRHQAPLPRDRENNRQEPTPERRP